MESIRNFSVPFMKGFIDSLRGVTVLLYLDREINERALARAGPGPGSGAGGKQGPPGPKQESKVLTRVLQSCILNGCIFMVSILVFEYAVLPGVQWCAWRALGGAAAPVWGWLAPALRLTFRVVWVLPLFLLTKLVNSLWFQDIADSAYRHRRGRPQLMSSVSKIIADSLFSLLVQALFLVQSVAVGLVPVAGVGGALYALHVSLLYALYAFEYAWFSMGWELPRRLRHLEAHWPYFLGFGAPLAALTHLPHSYVISGCVFSILFPIFILSGNEATPVMGSSPPCALRLFSPAVWLSNGLFRALRTALPHTGTSAAGGR